MITQSMRQNFDFRKWSSGLSCNRCRYQSSIHLLSRSEYRKKSQPTILSLFDFSKIWYDIRTFAQHNGSDTVLVNVDMESVSERKNRLTRWGFSLLDSCLSTRWCDHSPAIKKTSSFTACYQRSYYSSRCSRSKCRAKPIFFNLSPSRNFFLFFVLV